MNSVDKHRAPGHRSRFRFRSIFVVHWLLAATVAGLLTVVIVAPDVLADQVLPVAINANQITTPTLGENRLFISTKQRGRLDALKQKKVTVEPDVVPVTESAKVEPKAAPVKKILVPKTTSYLLNGFIRRPDRSTDVWINGALAVATSAVRVLQVGRSGAVVLRIDGKNYSLYPGQTLRVTKRVSELK